MATRQRGEAEFDLTLAHNRPDFNATPWLVTEVEHSLGDSGLGTRLQCEVSGASADQSTN
ncbi:hypothetical protein [Chromohalobacter nigrandesensis]|uniref:hypothetical protein n=1 Tax=Chromohalobacter nigrandesensis TaxID=119863 RepID=UPI001FF60451|nr:hypothetical protein [Chromohalobacter nigrandesensis]MCK0744127.1 hypothetical protein [Chromohalobacter nigrandesensis]